MVLYADPPTETAGKRGKFKNVARNPRINIIQDLAIYVKPPRNVRQSFFLLYIITALLFLFVTLVFGYLIGHMRQRKFKS